MSRPSLRVASVPSGHVYVRHLSPPEGDTVLRLPDPRPEQAASDEQWWPPVMLDPAWIDGCADSFDVFHVHFGFDALSAPQLSAIVDRLRAHGKPLVYTVHDLSNPHHADPGNHDAALDVLVPAADVLITLTSGAASVVQERWGRLAHVLPHPHVLDADDLGQPRPTRARPRVGVHLKSLRANMNPLPVVAGLAALTRSRDFDLVVDVHTDVVTEGMRNHNSDVVDLLRRLETAGEAEVHVHDYYSDDHLWAYFRSLDLSVLPYRFGTHSGWLEACFDVGTRVLAPRLGHYHDQEPGVWGYRLEDGVPVTADLEAAIDQLPGAAPWQADAVWRMQQRRMVAAAHEALYRDAVGGAR